jgi:hypothetical protein
MNWLDLNAEAVSTGLRLGEEFAPWLAELERVGASTPPASLPDEHEIDELFAHLGIAPEAGEELRANWPSPERNPELWWLLQHCHRQLVTLMGRSDASLYGQWHRLPSHLGTPGRLFFIYVYLATVPAVRQWHQERGIEDAVSWATLADLGEHIAIHRRVYGNAGLYSHIWLTLHFRGIIYRLGRLQFELWRFSPKWPIYDEASGASLPEPKPFPEAPALSIHIPESGGSIDPAACDASLAWAREFFARHFPEKQYLFARCNSWLLDPQLADYLSPTSNIVRFQRHFHLVPGGEIGDEDVIWFVFRQNGASADQLPTRTTLERAVVEHLQAGKHWEMRSGWATL